jgi:hypothetical protein
MPVILATQEAEIVEAKSIAKNKQTKAPKTKTKPNQH